MENFLELGVLDNGEEGILPALESGLMVVACSKNTYMYILEQETQYLLFMHVPGSPEGGQKQLGKDEKDSAIVTSLAKMADKLFTVKFEPAMDLFRVMASAENAIVDHFPPSGGDGDEDIEFIIPGQEEMER